MRSNQSIIPALIAGTALGIVTQAASLVHDYQFNGNLNDSLGGLPLTGHGGSLGTFGYYTFDPNQGVTFLGAASLRNNYTIGIRVSLNNIGSGEGAVGDEGGEVGPDGFSIFYRKILDFRQRTSDAGLYNYLGQLNFFPAGTEGNFPANTMVDIVISRDGSSGEVVTYVQGQSSISFNDASDDAVTDLFAGNAIFEFLQDDSVTDETEATGGVLDRIVVYDGPVNLKDVFATEVAVPEAGTVAAAGLIGLLAAGQWLRRRKG